MSNVEDSDGDGDSWIFDSLVNFLHGNIWKMPVLGFVEDKSVVFDPDSYANLSDEKEEEFRKIHEEYKCLVDYMLSSFMDDLQVTPEQVEDACKEREKKNSIAESHITKMALEQLQAAEDFDIFRRIMTRKNIDLQLQSLELLVSKYGVLSPSLRSEGCDQGDSGEDDFLQVVIRYCGEFGIFDDDINDIPKNSKATSISSTLHPNALSQIESPPSASKQANGNNATKDEKFSSSKATSPTGRRSGESSSAGRQKNTQCNTQAEKIPPNVSQIPAQREKAKQIDPVMHTTTSIKCSRQNAINDFSQLIQQDLTEGSTENPALAADLGLEAIQPARLQKYTSPAKPEPPPPVPQSAKMVNAKPGKKDAKKSVKFDETTVAEIATVAPEQHRILTSVRRALDEDSDDIEAGSMNIDMTGSEEDIEKRRVYLRTQRDKLVALKKRERERQLENTAGQLSRPKSARAAQMAMRSPPSGNGEKSLAARRALAAVLKQELLEK